MREGDHGPPVAAHDACNLIVLLIRFAHGFVVEADTGETLSDFFLCLFVVRVFFQGCSVADGAP